jgi:hypothetical protein
MESQSMNGWGFFYKVRGKQWALADPTAKALVSSNWPDGPIIKVDARVMGLHGKARSKMPWGKHQ